MVGLEVDKEVVPLALFSPPPPTQRQRDQVKTVEPERKRGCRDIYRDKRRESESSLFCVLEGRVLGTERETVARLRSIYIDLGV